MGQVFVYDSEQGKVVPREEFHREPKQRGVMIQSDLQPYKSMVNGQMIEGRAQHRAHLKQHRMIEVGNEKLTRYEPKSTINVRAALRRAWSDSME